MPPVTVLLLSYLAVSQEPNDFCAAGRQWVETAATNGQVLDLGGRDWDLFPEMAIESQVFPSNNDAGRVKSGLVLRGLKNVTIEGHGARLRVRGSPLAGRGRTTVIDAPMLPIIIDDCENITLRNFSLDWKTPGAIQGTCVRADEHSFDVRLETDRKFNCYNDQLYVEGENWTWPVRRLLGVEADTGAVLHRTGDNFGIGYEVNWVYRMIDAQTVRISGPKPAKVAPGNVVIFWCSNYDTGARRSPGIFINNSRGVTIEDVTINYSWGMGVIAQNSSNLTLRRMIVEPSGKRKFSIACDATHFVGCRGQLTIEDCRFQNQFDDAVNAHGLYSQIVRRLDERTLRVRIVHPQHQGVRGYRPGDRFAILASPYLSIRGHGVLRSFVAYNSETTDLVFDEPLPADLVAGDLVENLSAYPDIILRGCTIRWNRARGVLLNGGGKILVENNVFETAGSAILVESSGLWGESGPIGELTIRNNTFRDCAHSPMWGQAVIWAVPEFREKAPPNLAPFHGRLILQGNHFENCQARDVWAESFKEIVRD